MQTQVVLTSKTMLSGTAPHPHRQPTSWQEAVRDLRAVYLSGTLGTPDSPISWGKKFPLTSTVPSWHPTSGTEDTRHANKPSWFNPVCETFASSHPHRSFAGLCRAEVVSSGHGAGVGALCVGWDREGNMRSMENYPPLLYSKWMSTRLRL